jgi:uncharacterized membrane protein
VPPATQNLRLQGTRIRALRVPPYGIPAFYTETVARNLYILAGALLLFALISFIMSMTAGRMQPALPAGGTLWKTSALFLTVGGLIVALLGIMTALFEQIDRRTEERHQRHLGRRGPQRLDR